MGSPKTTKCKCFVSRTEKLVFQKPLALPVWHLNIGNAGYRKPNLAEATSRALPNIVSGLRDLAKKGILKNIVLVQNASHNCSVFSNYLQVAAIHALTLNDRMKQLSRVSAQHSGLFGVTHISGQTMFYNMPQWKSA